MPEKDESKKKGYITGVTRREINIVVNWFIIMGWISNFTLKQYKVYDLNLSS